MENSPKQAGKHVFQIQILLSQAAVVLGSETTLICKYYMINYNHWLDHYQIENV